MIQAFAWACHAAIFYGLYRWKPGHKPFLFASIGAGAVSVAIAIMGPKGALVVMALWGLLVAYLMVDTWRINRQTARMQGDHRRRLRAEHEAQLLASFQEHVTRWTCPHCGQRDFRVRPPVTDPIIECAECRYVIPALPGS